MTIELANPEDIAQVYALCTASHIENQMGGKGLEIDTDKSLLTLATCIENKLCFIARDEKNPKLINGLVIVSPNQVWFSTSTFLLGLIVYIKPEARSFRLAKSLLSTAKECAIMNGVPIVFDLFSQKDALKKKRLFTYLGFEEWGSSFLYIPK